MNFRGRGRHTDDPTDPGLADLSSGPQPLERPNLALVGMMGAGKSTVGELLAARLGWTFYDTDLLLEATFGEPIARIFEDPGEAAFRRAEELLVKTLRGAEHAVLATGGGLWLSATGRRTLGSFSHTAYLAAPPQVLWNRLRGGIGSRPLLLEETGKSTLERLLAQRDPVYRLADWTVETAELAPQAVVHQLLRKMKRARLVAPAGAAA